MKKLTIREIQHLSLLSGLNLTDRELDQFADDVNCILESLKCLCSTEVTPKVNRNSVLVDRAFRNDIVESCADSEQLLDSDRRIQGYLSVSRLQEIDAEDD